MDGIALDRHLGLIGIEVLILDGTGCAAVQSIGQLGAEPCYIKLQRAASDLLIGSKAQAYLAMGNSALEQDLRCFQDLSDAGLVVRTQQGGAIGGDEGMALEAAEHRVFLRREDMSAALEQDIAAVIVLDDLRLHTDAVELRSGIHMGNKAHRGLVLITRSGRDFPIDIAVLLTDIGYTHLLHHPFEMVCHIQLHGSGRTGRTGRIRRRIDLYQVNEFFQYTHCA